MNYAGYYSDLKQGFTQEDLDSLPIFAEQSSTLDQGLAEAVTRYLAGGYVLGDILSTIPDPRDPRLTLPMGTRTDGEWVWPADTVVICERHGIVPPQEAFVAKILAAHGICPVPTEEELGLIKRLWYR